MRAEQKLTRNGSATGVTIPKAILVYLGWLPGEKVIIELLEDRSLRVRQRDVQDFVPIRTPRLVYDEPGRVTGGRPATAEQPRLDVQPEGELVTK